MTQAQTAAVLVGVTALLVVWDVALALDSTRRNTISQAIADYDKRYPIIRFLFGVLMGHWFWRV